MASSDFYTPLEKAEVLNRVLELVKDAAVMADVMCGHRDVLTGREIIEILQTAQFVKKHLHRLRPIKIVSIYPD